MALPLATAPGDTPLRRWARRAVTIPGFVFVFAALAGLYPALLPVTAALDLARRRPMPLSRALTALLAYLAFETLGLVSLAALALSGAARGRRERLFRLEWWWARALLGLVVRIFRMRLEVEGLEAAAPGPILLFSNHVSLADVLLPAGIVSARHRLRLRYAAKRELVWDPCVDLVGHMLPNVFVLRFSADTPGDVARVQTLLADLGPEDGVFLMPEGTRFTEERRRRLRAGPESDEMARQARRLESLLPPRLGGVLGLFEENRGADVVFLAHTGFEGVRTLSDVWNGALVGRRLKVSLWRRPWAEVPAEREARAAWLLREWEALDAWVSRHREPPGDPGAGPGGPIRSAA